MRKLVMMSMLACMAVGVAMAAPVQYVRDGGSDLGYMYDGARDGAHVLYAEHGVADKVVLGLEYRDFVHEGHEYDLYGKYRVNNNIYLRLGNRHYDSVGNKLFGGVEGMMYLSDKFDGYAGVMISSEEKEYRIGALYDLAPEFDIDINYTYRDRDVQDSRQGVGLGLNYRF